jgi:Arc/MetJ family transcription regulator
MATNLAIDPELLNHALSVSGVRTKKEAVTIALKEFIARREQARIVESFGTLDWDEGYDHKADRRSRDLAVVPVE